MRPSGRATSTAAMSLDLSWASPSLVELDLAEDRHDRHQESAVLQRSRAPRRRPAGRRRTPRGRRSLRGRRRRRRRRSRSPGSGGSSACALSRGHGPGGAAVQARIPGLPPVGCTAPGPTPAGVPRWARGRGDLGGADRRADRLGAAWTWYAFRHRGVASGLRGAGLTLLPPAAWLTGTMEMFTEIGSSVVDWATSIVLQPGRVGGRRPGRDLGGAARHLRRPARARPRRRAPRRRRQREARAGQAPGELPVAGTKGEPVIDDDLADIEAILKRRGIT